jgi:hypothetical protein
MSLIPAACLRRMREHDLLPLYDAILSTWLGPDGRTFLIRCLPGGPSVARRCCRSGTRSPATWAC